MMLTPEDAPEERSPEQIAERAEEETFLLTLANRMHSEDYERGMPRGFMVMVFEGDGTFTHHLADIDGDTDWMHVVGNMEVMKGAIINTHLV